ncbi:amino acid adenylation domain-containing protein [Nocardia terpenica]|uniref:AMP-binding protein n=1 Tax=Nocardia terpenica TaxID=455432 RepID=A0A6G9YYZ0_9NOCA|nr:amino acid adenylation domain-containing protein [Nocardia terpenica]QIS18422.1 AMP-binding protein [Nocardia terpenica]
MSPKTIAHTRPATDLLADFAAAVHRHPDRPALVHGDTTLTYRDLDTRVRTAAAHLGPTPGIVGTLVSHTPDTIIQMLAILTAGGAYCPLDNTLPLARKQSLTTTIGAEYLLAATPNPVAPPGIPVVDGKHADSISINRGIAPAELAERPAYVLFTSGSTGRPKPVVTPRRALSAAVGSLRALFEITPEDRVLQFAALSWDTCFEEIFPALTAGAAVVFDDDAYSGSFPRFVRAVAARGVTVLDLPTAMWHELVLYLREEDARLPECVRLVVIGGEGAAPERLRQWRQAGTAGIRLLNTYGCTETTLITHAADLTGDADDRVPLGRALPHVREHVTEEGELLIAGPALALGYLDQPEQTARSFEVADHGDGPRRWFHTGDLVARGDDGLLHPRGRLDDQVKVRGVRVNPAEVEAQLTTHPAVTAAVVIGEQRLGRTALVAYVTVRSPVEPAELTGHLRQRLPGQFVPGIVKILPALATTASGKIDRAAVQRRSTGTMDPPSRGVGR